jgi:hypothetical protein
MFWNKKSEASPLGVPLGDLMLMLMLQPTSIKASLKGTILTARHEHYTIRIEVVPPENRESENGPIRAVVRMITELPKPILTLFQGKEAETTAAYNSFAALGSLCADHGSVYIGSRLTIYEAEDSWRTLHLPLLMLTTICGTEAILGALRRAMTNEGQRGGTSKWTEQDLAQVEGLLSRMCLCTTGELRLTAEFGWRPQDRLISTHGQSATPRARWRVVLPVADATPAARCETAEPGVSSAQQHGNGSP